jgi:hypothetical protein
MWDGTSLKPTLENKVGPHLTVLYDGFIKLTPYKLATGLAPYAPTLFNLKMKHPKGQKRVEAFPVPGCVAANYPQHVLRNEQPPPPPLERNARLHASCARTLLQSTRKTYPQYGRTGPFVMSFGFDPKVSTSTASRSNQTTFRLGSPTLEMTVISI